MPKSLRVAGAALAVAASLAMTAPAASAAARPAAVHHVAGIRRAAAAPVTASTNVIDHTDSSNQGGNWATDVFTRKATIIRVGQVPVKDCVATGTTGTGTCWLYDGKIADSGTFSTIPGAPGPRAGVEDQALTGSFSGGSSTIEFFSSWKTPNVADVPKAVSGPVSGRETTSNWVEQFFGPGAVFNDSDGGGAPDLGNWSWAYTLGFGTDKACPDDAYKWVDSAVNGGGGELQDGNILSPVLADCT